MNTELLRTLPAVDMLVRKCNDYINNNSKKDGHFMPGPSFLTHTVKTVLDELRKKILTGELTELPDEDGLVELVINKLYGDKEYNLRRVINGTGITLHTNLGRAPLSVSAAEHVYDVARGYCNLEYDIESGSRGSRYSHVEKLICELTGAESALAVNNNAAAVMLTLHALGYGREMIISRGEMVEIGGSFRIPAVMQISGVTLKEIGCTNKTRLSDYTDAVGDNIAAILKVHPSNYVISGFTQSVSIEELKENERIREANIPIIYDLGSGEFEDVDLNADIICFSADKLLGGPQGGIICGKKKYIDIIKKDDLIRTLRLDKLTIAALEATLTEYKNKNENDIPVRKILGLTKEELDSKYDIFVQMAKEILDDRVELSKIETVTETGGGSRPEEELPDICVGIRIKRGADEEISAEKIACSLRGASPVPIIGRIHEDVFMLSLRTMFENEYSEVISAISKLN